MSWVYDIGLAVAWFAALILMAFYAADLAADAGGWRWIYLVLYGVFFRVWVNPVVFGFRVAWQNKDKS